MALSTLIAHDAKLVSWYSCGGLSPMWFVTGYFGRNWNSLGKTYASKEQKSLKTYFDPIIFISQSFTSCWHFDSQAKGHLRVQNAVFLYYFFKIRAMYIRTTKIVWKIVWKINSAGNMFQMTPEH